MRSLRFLYVAAATTAVVILTQGAAVAGSLELGTWNLEGPAGLEGRGTGLKEMGMYFDTADAVVIEETLGKNQIESFLAAAKLAGWTYAVSDFAKDSYTDVYRKLEVAVITPHGIGTVKEVDPISRDDTEEMRAADDDIEVPAWLPEFQRAKTGSRGWLWVEIPSIKLVVVAVHLKSSNGNSGRADEENSWKREVIAASLVTAIREDAKARNDWSYAVSGDFNVAPGDAEKVGFDLAVRCPSDPCYGYDQTHALFGGGLVKGIAMRNLTVGLGATYAKGAFVDSPIDNVYAHGPAFDRTSRVIAERGPTFGSDHYAVRVTVD